jgi:hypothetical protein
MAKVSAIDVADEINPMAKVLHVPPWQRKSTPHGKGLRTECKNLVADQSDGHAHLPRDCLFSYCLVTASHYTSVTFFVVFLSAVCAVCRLSRVVSVACLTIIALLCNIYLLDPSSSVACKVKINGSFFISSPL